MTSTQLSALLPLIAMAAGSLLLLLQLAFIHNHRAAFVTFVIAIGATAVSVCLQLTAFPDATVPVTPLLRIEGFSRFFILLLLFTSATVGALGLHYLEHRFAKQPRLRGKHQGSGEFYFFLLLATLGACTLVCADHFASFFLALELVGLALYPLLAFTVPYTGNTREQFLSLEAAVKYLVLSALGSALLLFGVALVFAATGSLQFDALFFSTTNSLLLDGGIILLLSGCAFKLSLAPFHLWTADVYEGAPTPVTALIATLAKASLFAILFKVFQDAVGNEPLSRQSPWLMIFLALLAAASMLAGNLLALLQNNIKRLLAYSSIAHMGYVLVALMLAGQGIAREAALYFLTAYTLTSLIAFSVVSLTCDTALPTTPGGHHALPETIDPGQRAFYRGLLWRSPLTTLCFAAALLSLAGIPLTIGFVGKFYVIAAGIGGRLWWLIVVLIAASALGLFYYLKLLLTLVQPVADRPRSPTDDDGNWTNTQSIAPTGLCILLLLTGLLLFFGIYPQPLINGINAL